MRPHVSTKRNRPPMIGPGHFCECGCGSSIPSTFRRPILKGHWVKITPQVMPRASIIRGAEKRRRFHSLDEISKYASWDYVKLKFIELNKNQNSYLCSVCNMAPTWQGTSLILVVDHIDNTRIEGKKNNSFFNLRLLCPNCHSQTHNFGGRGTKAFQDKLKRGYL